MIRPAGRVKRFPNSCEAGRVGSGDVRNLTGRIVSGGFQISRVRSGPVGSGRVGSGRVGSGRVGSGRVGSPFHLDPAREKPWTNYLALVYRESSWGPEGVKQCCLPKNKDLRRRSSQRKTSSGQACQTDRSVLKPSSWPSVKINYWSNAIGQGLKMPSVKRKHPAVTGVKPIDLY